MTLVPIKV